MNPLNWFYIEYYIYIFTTVKGDIKQHFSRAVFEEDTNNTNKIQAVEVALE